VTEVYCTCCSVDVRVVVVRLIVLVVELEVVLVETLVEVVLVVELVVELVEVEEDETVLVVEVVGGKQPKRSTVQQ
jgi:hypothetical protein